MLRNLHIGQTLLLAFQAVTGVQSHFLIQGPVFVCSVPIFKPSLDAWTAIHDIDDPNNLDNVDAKLDRGIGHDGAGK